MRVQGWGDLQITGRGLWLHRNRRHATGGGDVPEHLLAVSNAASLHQHHTVLSLKNHLSLLPLLGFLHLNYEVLRRMGLEHLCNNLRQLSTVVGSAGRQKAFSLLRGGHRSILMQNLWSYKKKYEPEDKSIPEHLCSVLSHAFYSAVSLAFSDYRSVSWFLWHLDDLFFVCRSLHMVLSSEFVEPGISEILC